jgi:adiponectin receptor
MALDYFMGLGILNFSGSVIYTARIPERFYPRRFDVWGSSHQIMHVLVMCGALSHSMGLSRSFWYWKEHGTC